MAGTVRPIDRKSVHQICSGQVVLNLATAVKELVENSLDAGATIIEIRLKDHGSESVEVIDNGSGVEDTNFQALTLKHHTSKLQDFSDLTSVDTFGFRGEALSSLCALSDLTVLTCHKSAKVGTRLEYDHDGKINKQTHCPRQTGTTVSLQNLFSTLPVRHKEFQRNLKKEFAKMVHILQGYCIISEGVKLTCTNQGVKGGKSVVVATNGNSSMRENISSVFGSKQVYTSTIGPFRVLLLSWTGNTVSLQNLFLKLQRLLEITQEKPTDEICSEFSLKTERIEADLFKISGFISKPDHGQGRSSADRQYLFINRRPFDFPKVTKLINEVYHTYNRHQYPMCILDTSLSKDAVDVNLTPDKRKVLVQEERLLLAIIKSSLLAMFAPRVSTYEMNQTLLSPLTLKPLQDVKRSSSEASSKTCVSATLADLKRSFSNPGAIQDSDVTARKGQQQPKLAKFISKFRSPPKKSEEDLIPANDPVIESRDLDDLSPLTSKRANHGLSEHSNIEIIQPKEQNDFENDRLANPGILSSSENKTTDHAVGISESSVEPEPSLQCITMVIPESVTMTTEGTSEKESSGYGSHDSMQTESSQEQSVGDGLEVLSDKESTIGCKRKTLTRTGAGGGHTPVGGGITKRMKIHKTDEGEDILPATKRKEVLLPISVAGLHRAAERQQSESAENMSTQGIHFKAKIAPSDNTAAENELRKEISKDMFAKMQILGQFNLGFIIVRLIDDLFIIDQHASDEKYNFESLQKNTVLQGQRLIQPMPLELTAVNESILLDNMGIFNKNGFEFTVDLEAPPTKRVKLTSVPVSRNWTFSKDDVDELIFMLSDAPGIHCRPSRVRQMFASRSCRKSVMIGTALSKPDMKKLVLHMGEIEQPWNCPHGRPTMRHLFNLKLLPD